MNSNSENGFTLVELAIVLMIIGLLIGGVLRGQELLENARISSTVSQVSAYQGALVTFRDIYQGYPGDISTATNRIPGCTTQNDCTNGNANGIVGNVITWIPTDVSGATENTQFWKQLALTHLISGVNPSSVSGNPEWGATAPASKYSGGFQIVYDVDQDPTRTMIWNGHMLRMQLNVVGDTSEQPGTYPVSPKVAYRMDSKMDDGDPGSGSVTAFDAGVAPASGRCETPNPYDAWSESLNCIMLFKF